MHVYANRQLEPNSTLHRLKSGYDAATGEIMVAAEQDKELAISELSSLPMVLKPVEVRRFLRIGVAELERLVETGDLEAFDTSAKSAPRRKWRIYRSTLEAFLCNRTAGPVAATRRGRRRRKSRMADVESFV